jgi:hypothetical protein
MKHWLTMGDDARGTVANPVAPWLFDYPGYVIWAVLAIVLLRKAHKTGQLGFSALVFFSATSMFWQEFYADWGAKLVYTPVFALMPWESAYTTPNKPWFMPVMYGNYFLAIFLLQVWLVERIRRSGTRSLLGPVLMVSVPFFYAWDFTVEGLAAAMGWWTYLDPLGPVMRTAHGALPLLHPLGIFTVYGTVTTYVLARRDDTGRPAFESLGGVQRVPAGAGREVRRLLTWIVVMNVVYFLFLVGPCMAVRIASGT